MELELIINSIQFSMNWIGIELKDFELELNWNWKLELIGIDQFNQFNFNSTPYFTRLNIFCICLIMEIAVWQAISWKQTYPHAPLCVPSMGSAGVFGHEGLTITSITLRYFQLFNSLVIKSWWPTKIISSLVPCDATLHQMIVYSWFDTHWFRQKNVCHQMVPSHYFNQC